MSGIHRLDLSARRQRLVDAGMADPDELSVFDGAGLSAESADRMIENALGTFSLPAGIGVNLRINGVDRVAAMAIEEPSVVAAASHAAKLLRHGGGIEAHSSEPIVVGQVQLLDVPDPDRAERAIQAASLELLHLANQNHRRLTAAGGGARSLELRRLEPLGPDDPVGPMVVVHLQVDVRDAMGANVVNTMCETVAPRLEDLSGGRARLRILTNLCDHRTVTVRGRVPLDRLDRREAARGSDLAQGIVEASVFAERDPYRATTHNKGIMNGVDAVLVAAGQDWRAVEAGAHAYAARNGRYAALARWRVTGEYLHGEMTLPLAVGVVGGVVKVHPGVRTALRLGRVHTASDLAELAAAVGLAQNLGALRALAGDGIQAGHMRLHARNLAAEVGAVGSEIDAVSRAMAEAREYDRDAAQRLLNRLRNERAAP